MLHLRELRIKAGVSQTTVANALGISRQSYSYYESGKRDPDTEMLKNLADYFNVSTDFILGRDPAAATMEEYNIVLNPEFVDLYGVYEKLPRQKRMLVFEMARAMSSEEI